MTAGGPALDAAAWGSAWRGRAVRDKAVLALGLLLLVLVLPPWPGAVLVAVAAIALLLGPAGVRPGLLLRCLAAPLAFIVIGAASVLVSIAWEGGPVVRVTSAGVAAAATLLARGLAGTAALLVLATTTPMVDLIAALRRARMPDACIEVASLVYRMLFVLLESVRTITEAQSARLGYGTRRATLRSSAALTGAVLLRSWERARRLEEGLAGRGYTTSLRTLDPPLRASGRFLVAAVALLAVILAASVAISALADIGALTDGALTDTVTR